MEIGVEESRCQDALNAYSKAHRINPNRREVRRKMAVALTLLRRPEEAQKYQ